MAFKVYYFRKRLHSYILENVIESRFLGEICMNEANK